MLFGLSLLAGAALLAVMLYKGGFQASCHRCMDETDARREPRPATDR